MNLRVAIHRFAGFLLAGALLLAPALGFAQASSGDAAARLPNVERLLRDSSGARQVMQSRNPKALQKREQALALYAEAVVRIDRGEHTAAADLLNRSTRLMFEAIRLATPKSLAADLQTDHYGQRKKSVQALREAFGRIAGESGAGDEHARVDAQVAALIVRADGLLAGGDGTAARFEIDKAYHLIKVGIDSVRSGQTLVRSLQFDTPRDEYLYEVDRNDTHGMLIGLLVDEAGKSEAARRQVDQFVEQARVLREQAEAYAGEQAYPQAIELLEQSTRQLVRAIRSAGVYIPG